MDAPRQGDQREAAGGWLPPEPAGARPDAGPATAGAPPPAVGGRPETHGTPPPAAPSGYLDEPGNSEAVAALVLGIVSLALLLVSFGFSSIVSLACGVLAIIFGRNGRRKVDERRTRKGRAQAQAGFVMGIIGTVLSILATVFWVLMFVLGASSGQFGREFNRGFEMQSSVVMLDG